MTQVSIIVPIYNSENTLDRCISSLLSQTYKDYELLLINDGSTDRSADICDFYATKDARIKVFHKKNGGVSSARNLGLDNACGKWLTFVDSDDAVSDLYLYNLLSHAEGVDLVISYAEHVYADGHSRKEMYKSQSMTDDYEALFTHNDLHWHTAPWSKLFKRALCTDLRFVDGMHIGEDMVFLYTYMLKCNKIFVSSDTDYFYFVDSQGSLTKRINSLDCELLAYRQVMKAVAEIIKVKRIESPAALSALQWVMFYYIRRVLNAIYYDGIKRSLPSRLQIIRSIELQEYINYTGPISNKECVYKLLLKYRLYIPYDLLRTLIAFVRK